MKLLGHNVGNAMCKTIQDQAGVAQGDTSSGGKAERRGERELCAPAKEPPGMPEDCTMKGETEPLWTGRQGFCLFTHFQFPFFLTLFQ